MNLVCKFCLEVSVGATPGGKGLRRCCEVNPSVRAGPRRPGERAIRPRRAPLNASRSPSRASAAILLPGAPRVDV